MMELQDLINLCDSHNIKYEDQSSKFGKKIRVFLPRGRDHTALIVSERRCPEIFSNIQDFYKYRFVKSYEAIWSIEDDFLESEVITPFYGGLFRRLSRRLQDDGISEKGDEDIIILPSPIKGATIEISPSTEMFESLNFLKHERQQMHIRPGSSFTFKVKGAGLDRHEKTVNFIEKILASICFQLNVMADISVQLAPEREPRKYPDRPKDEKIELTVVKYEYDLEPLSLFWHAENLLGMPLQKYLAYYQAIEYYFTIYSLEEAQRKIRNLMKSPAFDIDKDKDLSKVLNIVKFSGSSNSFGNELSQLKSTISACVNADELKEWFSEREERDSYFELKSSKKISKYIIRSNVSDDELMSAIASRVYDIRCRIVHTKGTESNVDVLHPMSYEARTMEVDVELIRALAMKVIISNGRPLGISNA